LDRLSGRVLSRSCDTATGTHIASQVDCIIVV